MAMQWFHQISEGEPSGPVDSAELRRLTEAGIVRPDTLVRQGVSGCWVRAEQVQGLFQRSTAPPSPSFSASPPPPPPPPPPVPESGAPSRAIGGESPIRHGLDEAAVHEASEKPERVWPVTWAAIIVASGTVLLLLWALVFRGGNEPQQPAEKDQPLLGAAQSAESGDSAPQPQPLGPQSSETPIHLELADRRGTSDAKSTELSAAQLYARSSPSVVTVSVLNERGQEIGSGSGFLLDESWIRGRSKDFDCWLEAVPSLGEEYAKSLAAALDVQSGPARIGCLVTNHHVINAAVGIHVTLPDGSRGSVDEVVTESEEMDLAVLLAEFISEAPLTTLNLADATPSVGSKVFAIGNPAGLTNSLSEGIVSGYRDMSPRVRWLQTTAPISPGSSGGPLLLTDGRVVGVTTAMRREGQNLNFAVPSVEVRRFLAQPFVPRELWKGRSYKEEESRAYLDAGVADFKRAATDRSRALLDLVRAYHFFGDGRSTADELLRAVSAALPSIPKEYKYIAVHAQGRAHYKLAQESRERHLKPPVDVNEYYTYFARNAHGRQAVASFEQAVRERPDFAPGYAWLARCRIAGGEWAEGLLAADSLAKLVPRCAEAYELRAHCFEELGRYGKALEDYREAAELNPVDPDVHFSLASAQSSVGDPEAAIDSYKKALALGHSAPGVCYNNMGPCYSARGEHEKAIWAYEQAIANGLPIDLVDKQIAKERAKLRGY